jgi:ABC-type multidrug transport system fused ATPase/permease subunit
MFKTIADLVHILPSRLRREILIMLFFLLLSTFFEIISIASIVPFLISSFGNGETSNFFIGRNFSFSGNQPGTVFIIYGITFIVFIFLSTFLRIFILNYSSKVSFQIGLYIKKRYYESILHQSFERYSQINSGEVIAGINKSHFSTVNFILPLFTGIVSTITALSILIALLLVDPTLTLVGGSFFLSAYILISVILRGRLYRNSITIANSQSRSIIILQECLGNIKDIILRKKQDFYLNRLFIIENQYSAALKSNAVLGAFPRYAIEGFGLISIAVFIIYSTLAGTQIQTLIPTLAAFGLGAQKLIPLLQSTYSGWSGAHGNYVQVEEILKIIASKPMIIKSKLIKLPNYSLTLEQVSYQYQSTSEFILKNLDINFQEGKIYGVIGKTGSGKSTLINILLGLSTPSKGQISFGGNYLSPETIDNLRMNVCHVPQSIYLSDLTIAENVAFGEDKDAIDYERVIFSLKKSLLYDFVMQLDKGIDTAVGERGAKLSGGQIQRIGIARLFYNPSKIIILDEATSALDTNTESIIINNIIATLNNCTIIMIAHRVNTLKRCDLIYEIVDGQIHRTLTYENLIESS